MHLLLLLFTFLDAPALSLLIFVVMVTSVKNLNFSPERLPPFLTEALFCRGAPLDTRRRLLFINVLAAIFTFNPLFVREHFHLGAAFGAFIHGSPKVPDVLTGAFSIHNYLFLPPYAEIIIQANKEPTL